MSLNIQFNEDQLKEILEKAFPVKKKNCPNLETTLKLVQLILLIAAAGWAFWIAVVFDYAGKQAESLKSDSDLKQKEAAIKGMELEQKRTAAQIMREGQEDKAKALKTVDIVHPVFEFHHKERLDSGEYKWEGLVGFTLINNTDHSISITYSMLDVFLGTLNREVFAKAPIVLPNSPPTIFAYIAEELPLKPNLSNPIEWHRTLSIGSTTKKLLGESAPCKEFFSKAKCDLVLTDDQFLVSELAPGQSTMFEQDFVFRGYVGDYIGVACSYGWDDNFVKDENDSHVVPYFELTLAGQPPKPEAEK